MQIFQNNIDAIETLCKAHKVKNLYAFGSVTTNKFTQKSDVDLIVNFRKMKLDNYADNYFDLKFSLQKLFGRDVDLLEGQAIKNPFFLEKVEADKILIYEG